MNASYKNWLQESTDDGIISLTLDKPDTSTNVLSQAILLELQTILNEIKNTPAQALVFQSAKENCFIAGADIKEFANFQHGSDVNSTDDNNSNAYEKALQAIQLGQQVMNSIAELPMPTFAFINGHCLGGGMELALACDYRIASDNHKTRLGLPEVKLGIHPGFGGTIRSNQLLGVFKSMNLMLSGRTLSVYSGKKFGLIDELVSPQIKAKNFHQVIKQWLESKTIKTHQPPFYQSLLELSFMRPIIAFILKKSVSKRVLKSHYPAPFALIKLWQSQTGNLQQMLQQEAESVARLITGETAQNLIRVFYLQDQLKSLAHSTTDKTALQHIHVMGAGVMGGDIAIWCVYKGFTVTVHDRNHESLARLMQRGSRFFSKKLKQKHLFQSAMDRLIPDINNDGIKKADLLIEAIIEDVQAKQQVFLEAEQQAKAECIFATNTSSIPLDDISQSLQQPDRLVGLHFFNPVSRMPLIEIVSSDKTAIAIQQSALQFAGAIGKLPLPVTSTPGFLVNRVLTPYLMEAIELYSEGVPAAFIDKAAKDFGMPMGPIELADKVGLDICLSVASNLSQSQDIQVPQKLIKWVANGRLGLKSGHGFYHYKNGKLIPEEKLSHKTYQNMSLTQVSDRLLFRLFNEAVACLDEKVIANEDYLDAGIIFGTGFAPFLGGPIHYIKHQGVNEMDHTLIDLSRSFGKRFNPVTGWHTLVS